MGISFAKNEYICPGFSYPDTFDVVINLQNKFQRSVGISVMLTTQTQYWGKGLVSKNLKSNVLEWLICDQILGQLDGEFLDLGFSS